VGFLCEELLVKEMLKIAHIERSRKVSDSKNSSYRKVVSDEVVGVGGKLAYIRAYYCFKG